LDQGGNRHAPANTPGIRHVAFALKTSTPSSPACEPAARSSSASWSATRTATGSATSAARRGSSSSRRSRLADQVVHRSATTSGRPPRVASRSSCGRSVWRPAAAAWLLEPAVGDDEFLPAISHHRRAALARWDAGRTKKRQWEG
jgi:hypothetical protein